MTAGQTRAAGVAAADLTTEVAALVEGVHRGVSGRVFRALGPVAAPVRVAHDLVARGVHASVRVGLRAGSRSVGSVAAHVRSDAAPRFDATRRGNAVLGVINGIVGDALAADAPELAVTTAVRSEHGDVPVTREALSAAFPHATPSLVVFLHGLCETEDSWDTRADPAGQRGVALGPRLAADGWTPLYLRYNSGRRVSANGEDVAALLAEVHAQWPVPVDRIVLVGHSMGGLVARSALHQAVAGAPWLAATTDLVCLGTPHHGAPLEQVVNAAGPLLRRLPETRPFDTFLRRRSSGVKDLRYGNVRREDWEGHDPDERLRDRRGPAHCPERVRLHLVAATLGPRTTGVGALAGDLLVGFASATGDHPRLALLAERVHHLPGGHHFTLLDDPRVLEILRGVTSAAPPGSPHL